MNIFRRTALWTVVLILSILCTLVSFLIGVMWTNMGTYTRDAIYLTRPIWDRPEKHPEIIIPHFYAKNLKLEHLCRLHNWTVRPNSEIPRVIDAVIFSGETDMLEIRLRELWTVVDKFVVVEADRTFTGQLKPFYLQKEMRRFAWARKKLVYHKTKGLVRTKISQFFNEGIMRGIVGSFIVSSPEVGAKNSNIIIESDLDEIPSWKTIGLLKSCRGYPDGLHLQMKTYMYSFEFYVDRNNWKPHITIFDNNEFSYHHQWASNQVLADAGWHCSFCFRYLEQFTFKMKAFSHNDRVTSKSQLFKRNIQENICRGADIFDMYPEAYTYKELISKMGNIPKTDSAIGIQEYVVQNSHKFGFLLPGGCLRADIPSSQHSLY